jgi:hypothetical protein
VTPDGKAPLQPHEEMHERAIEKRIAFAEQRDIEAGLQALGDRGGARFIERRERSDIAGMVEGNFGGDGIVERQFLARVWQPAIDNFARIAAPPCFGEIGDDGRRLNQAYRFHRQQFRIPRPEADAIETPCLRGDHSAALASALTAAAAIALPPLRPRTTIDA